MLDKLQDTFVIIKPRDVRVARLMLKQATVDEFPAGILRIKLVIWSA